MHVHVNGHANDPIIVVYPFIVVVLVDVIVVVDGFLRIRLRSSPFEGPTKKVFGSARGSFYSGQR